MKRSLWSALLVSLLLVACEKDRPAAGPPPPPPPGPQQQGMGPPPGPGPNAGGNSEIRRKPDGTCVQYDHPQCPPGGTCDQSIPRPVPCPPGM